MKVATGLSIDTHTSPDLAAQAVTQAMQAADITIASSVLLLLTSEFARDPVPALRAAAKASSCTQVMGCSAPGIFTEQDWVLDAPAAAAMVFSGNVVLGQPSMQDDDQLLLTLAAPNAINTTWMTTLDKSPPGLRFGGVSGDAIGQGPFSVWENGKGTVMGHCEAALRGVKGVVAAAHGLRILNMPRIVSKAEAHDVQLIAGKPALKALQNAYDGDEALPLHRLMAVYADTAEAISAGDYQLATLVSGNDSDQSITLAKCVQPGQFLCWGIREVDAAQADLQQTAINMESKLGGRPDFGLLFSCLGRGPYFYGGVDRDLSLLRIQFPGMPLIGFYGNGEIAPANDRNDGAGELLQYSAVLGLFSGGLFAQGMKK
jgi:small ligand-binding sensory domain FIST